MKKPLEIIAYQVKIGSARELVALELDGKCPARDFLTELETSNSKGFQILDGARQLYEFRTRSGIRLYCFLAGQALVFLTNGGKKNTKKEQNRDIQSAKRFFDRFEQLINQGAVLTIIEP